MDEFAQTRQPDDLFDDEFTPYAESDLVHPAQQPPSMRQVLNPVQRETATPPTTPAAPDTAPNVASPEDSNSTDPTSRPITKSELKPPLSVRGDRSATGGILKPKLTEDELSARLATARLNNAKREEAHRLAEADEAEFQQREAQEIQKRRQEGLARREMDREREKNRQKKLAVKSGREWDESKEAVELPIRSGGYFRGANGGHRGSERRGGYDGGVRDEGETIRRNGEYVARGRGRGRSMRGNFRGDRGRGGHGSQGTAEDNKTRVPTASDFPELPRASTGAGPEKPKLTAVAVDNIIKSTSGAQQSWADQVEASK